MTGRAPVQDRTRSWSIVKTPGKLKVMLRWFLNLRI